MLLSYLIPLCLLIASGRANGKAVTTVRPTTNETDRDCTKLESKL